MKKNYLFFALIMAFQIHAQVGIGTTAPQGALDITSATNGILVPRVVLSSKAVSAPVVNPQGGGLTTGTLVFNTATAGVAPNNVVPGFYFWTGTAWSELAGAPATAWNLTGNAGTNANANFVGTSDAQDLRLRTNNTQRFTIGNANGQLASYSSGAANAPTYSWTPDTNTGIYSPSVDNIGFTTNATERFRIPNANQVHAMNGGSAALPFYSFAGDSNTGMYNAGTDALSLATNGSERMRVNNNGITFFSNNFNQDRFRFECNVLTASTDAMAVYNTGGAGSNQWTFNAYQATADGGALYAICQSTSNTNMAINGVNQGINGIGARGLHIANTGAGTGVLGISNSSQANGVFGNIPTTGFWSGFGGLFQGGLGYANGIYNVSDSRLKTDVKTIGGAIDKIKSLRGVSYKHDNIKYPEMFAGDNKTYLGFIAQEVKTILPEIVAEKNIFTNPSVLADEKQIDNTSGKELLNVVDYTQIIPVLVEAVKEQQKLIESQNERIELLENKLKKLNSR